MQPTFGASFLVISLVREQLLVSDAWIDWSVTLGFSEITLMFLLVGFAGVNVVVHRMEGRVD